MTSPTRGLEIRDDSHAVARAVAQRQKLPRTVVRGTDHGVEFDGVPDPTPRISRRFPGKGVQAVAP